MPRANMNAVLGLSLAVPSVSEQQHIVRSLDRLSGMSGAIASAYSNKVVALQRLQASLLDQAFRGELKFA